jgi:hypothetical protein
MGMMGLRKHGSNGTDASGGGDEGGEDTRPNGQFSSHQLNMTHRGGCGDFCLLKYGSVCSGESQPKFGMNILPTTSAALLPASC